MSNYYEDVWSFSTAQFTVTLAVAPEEDSPEGYFENEEDVAFASEGGWHWFSARVQVMFGDNNITLGSDYLGACSYHSLEDFMKPGDYFRNMVREAISQARKNLAALKAA